MFNWDLMMFDLFHFQIFLAFRAPSAIRAMVQASHLSSCWWRHSSPLLCPSVLCNLLPCPFVPRQGIVIVRLALQSFTACLFSAHEFGLLCWGALCRFDCTVLNLFEMCFWNLAFSDPFPFFPAIHWPQWLESQGWILMILVPSGHSSRAFRTQCTARAWLLLLCFKLWNSHIGLEDDSTFMIRSFNIATYLNASQESLRWSKRERPSALSILEK